MNRFIALFFALTIGVSAMQLSDVVVDSTSIRAMGRGGAVVAAPYGADSLTTNPAGLAQQGSGVHYYNMDFEENVSNKSTSILYHRKSFGAGQWGFENNALDVNFFGLGYAKKSRNGLDWGFNYKTIDVKTTGETSRYWSSDLGLILHLNRSVDIGVVGENILGEKNRPFGSSLTSGVVIKSQRSGLKFFSDVVFDRDRSRYADSFVRYGVDALLSKDFTVRFGGDQRYLTAGVSFDFLFASVDYAIKAPKSDQDEQVVALGVRLGKAKAPAEFRRKYALFKPKALAYIQVDGSLTPGKSSISLLGGRKVGSNDLLRLIEKANHDDDCKGYILRVKNLSGELGNIAVIQEIRSELSKGKALGKKNIRVLGWLGLTAILLLGKYW